MKQILTCIILAICLRGPGIPLNKKAATPPIRPVQNLFIITIDGFRWQEIFGGADSLMLHNEEYTPDTATMRAMYWAATPGERREKLLPFFWNVIARRGQVYGNRHFGNNVNTSNLYCLSYPGYNEIFTGEIDLAIWSNGKRRNPNQNVLEYLNRQAGRNGSVVAFTSWDVFPYILNESRSGIVMNSGYEKINDADALQMLINRVESDAVYNKTDTRQDELTFIAAKEYIEKFRPSVVYLAFGETDETAHQGRYDLYLEKAAAIDKMMAELWNWVQSTPGYKNNTTFIITTDHGRGKNSSTWANHGLFVKGSSQTWLALMGPNISPLGEMKDEEQIYQKQIAQTIAALVGKDFQPDQFIAPAIAVK